MTVFSFFSCKRIATVLLALSFSPMPHMSFDAAQAETFIERMLKQDARKARQRSKAPSARRSRNAPSKKRDQTAVKTDTGPMTVPVPTPAPRPADTPEKPGERETTPVPAEPPRRAEKPEAPTTEPAPPQAEPEKDERVYQVSCPALISGEVEGKLLPPIEDGDQCGAHSPLSLTAIGKDEPLKLANAVTTNCAMAVTLAQWSVEVKKAVRDVYGTDVKISEIGTGSDYQCRKVNGGSTGRVSEHAFANALDIMSFKFSDGSKTGLETGWNGSDKEKTFWRAVHGASCKLFMTVIGPDGDAAHRTNMHLDQGCHGKSCLARICQ